MKSVRICAAMVLLLTAPLAAFAQSPDSNYCKALGEKYQTYDQATGKKGESVSNVDANVAISKCATKPSESIPTLEKILTDAKISLPPRS
jgi:hypothetical protein